MTTDAGCRSRPSRPARQPRQSGFTLLEVLAALMILALAFGALLRLVSSGLGGPRRGRGLRQREPPGGELARRPGRHLAARARVRRTGAFDERFRWRASISAAAGGGAGRRARPGPVVAYEVELAVRWGEGLARAQHLTLSTLRLAPAP